MKITNNIVIVSLFVIAVAALIAIGYLAHIQAGNEILNQLVLIPVSVVSGLAGWLTSEKMESKKE
jgi:uncharacterized membrane protein YfcA